MPGCSATTRRWARPSASCSATSSWAIARQARRERDYLLKIINTSPRQFENLDQDGRHFDCYLDALRYDAVHDLLTPQQAKQVEDTFRVYIDYQLGDRKEYTRTSWLPNMQWPRPMAAHLMAVALEDQKLIRTLANGNGGWKWYLDDYISDRYFYNEEFGKQYSMVGEMLLFARGLERLGLDDLGYGYTGKGDATVRKYLEGFLRVGYPRTDLPGGLPRYGKVTMGDAKGGFPGGPRFLFQQAIVTGYLADGSGGNARWMQANMNGRDHRGAKVDKMLEPLWFEIAQAKWPNAGFGYFLTQMRGPKDDKYYPSLYFDLDPMGPAQVKPPAPSYVAPERGFAFLRAEEGPGYWESAAPAVALQFATLYVHYLSDCFSLLGYQAYNRPIYVNRTISYGYAGGPWDFSVRSHCGVVVDGLQAQPIGPIPERHDFSPLAKFVSVRTPRLEKPYYTGKEVRSTDQPQQPATEVYPGVGLSRSLILTREYLFDVYRLTSNAPHTYHWLVHAPGEAQPDNPKTWADSTELQKTLFDVPEIHIKGKRRINVKNAGWSLTTLQTCALPDVAKSKLAKEWYDRKVGVAFRCSGRTERRCSPSAHPRPTPRAVRAPPPRPARVRRHRCRTTRSGASRSPWPGRQPTRLLSHSTNRSSTANLASRPSSESHRATTAWSPASAARPAPQSMTA